MNKRLEKLEWKTKMLELEMAQLQNQIDTTALAQLIIEQNKIDRETWAEINKKQDEILRLNREALAG